MPIYRTEKNKDYVVMSNIFLQRKDLSIKAKGLLAYMICGYNTTKSACWDNPKPFYFCIYR